MREIHKYPRTHHLAGSRLGPGDEDLEQIWTQARSLYTED